MIEKWKKRVIGIGCGIIVVMLLLIFFNGWGPSGGIRTMNDTPDQVSVIEGEWTFTFLVLTEVNELVDFDSVEVYINLGSSVLIDDTPYDFSLRAPMQEVSPHKWHYEYPYTCIKELDYHFDVYWRNRDGSQHNSRFPISEQESDFFRISAVGHPISDTIILRKPTLDPDNRYWGRLEADIFSVNDFEAHDIDVNEIEWDLSCWCNEWGGWDLTSNTGRSVIVDNESHVTPSSYAHLRIRYQNFVVYYHVVTDPPADASAERVPPPDPDEEVPTFPPCG